MGVSTMELNEFIETYGEFVKSYKKYDNNVIMIKFENWDQVMWLKGVICEKMDMKVKDNSNFAPRYWFEPNN